MCREDVNRLELYFILFPYYYLIVHLYWMLLYIILYKHVFENMYALRLYHAVCYLALSFSIRLSLISLMICTTSTSMHYAFHLSAYFLIILTQVFQSSTHFIA